jgi:hypothetical protein
MKTIIRTFDLFIILVDPKFIVLLKYLIVITRRVLAHWSTGKIPVGFLKNYKT